jgi:uncharacterized cupin superfamily protein
MDKSSERFLRHSRDGFLDSQPVGSKHRQEVTMPKIFNAENISLEKRIGRIPEFAWHTSPRLAELSNAKHFQFDIRSLDPGKFSFPYHFHRAAEELFVIFSGEATLRSPEGFQKLSKGDVIFFEQGAEGAHQLYNHGDSPCIYLDLRTTIGIDVCEYPDSGKVNILPYMQVFESSATVDYYQGEENVTGQWPEELLRKQ